MRITSPHTPILIIAAITLTIIMGSCKSQKKITSASSGYNRNIPRQEVTLPPSLKGARRDVVKEASTWIGTPYSYGGKTKKKGTDCSGMVMEVFRTAAGLKLPRTTVEQQKHCKRIKRDQLLAGDLVFFANTTKGSGRVSHVGLYIGGNEMIHASSSRGVMVSRIDDRYFGPRFHTASRVPGLSGKASPDKPISSRKKDVDNPLPPPVEITPPPDTVPEVTLDQLDLILQQKVDSISNSLLFD